ncbi:MAG TPA: hypothetical protein VIL20_08795 [Sandaracinaceae bacterium]
MRRARPAKKLRKRGWLGWLRDVAGHATTETVIMIPVFVAIWGGIWYTHGRYRRAINNAQFTRAAVWTHAFDGCEGGSPNSTELGDRSDNRDGFIDGAVSLLFGSGIIPGFQFDEVEGRRFADIDRPAVLGEGNVRMGYNVVVLCNERPASDVGFWAAARDMFFP